MENDLQKKQLAARLFKILIKVKSNILIYLSSSLVKLIALWHRNFKSKKMSETSLHPIDYIIFILLLCVSMGVGVYYAYKV